MKRIILLIHFLTLTFFMQAQEKVTYQLNGKTIAFTISQKEMYVEYAVNQKTAIQRMSKDGFEELSSNSAILKISELKGTFSKRQQSLRGRTSQNYQRIEPVLIYNDGTKQIAKGELNIKLKANASIDDLLKGKTFTVVPNEFDKDLYLVKLNLETSELFELVNQLQNDNKVEFAEPNFIRIIKPHTNDQFLSSQWSINNQGYLGGTVDADMDVDDAWNYATGAGIKVAVIDEGVDLSHPDLTPNLLSGFDATGNGSNGAPNESNNDAHGTACAGIIAAVANNTNGIAGVAYNAKIIPIRIAYSVGPNSTSWVSNDNWIANGIDWAWQNGADVLSNSYGGGSYSSTIERAINNAVNFGREDLNGNPRGAVVLFSSGNDRGGNGAPVSFPATVASAISVGASSMCDERKNLMSCDGESFWGSNYGTSLDVVAPGVKIYTTDISGSAGYRSGDYRSDFNGTSSACPNAAGVVALILSVNPNLTQQEAREILERNTDKVSGYNYSNNSNQPNGTWNDEMGYGRINAHAAVLMAQESLPNQIKGPSEVCSGDRPTYTLTDVPAGATIKWKFSTILSGQGTSKVQIGIFYGTDVRTLTAEVTYQGETSTFTKQISSESVSTPRSVPKIRKARNNMDFLVCCSSYGGETYTLDHAECYQNCDDLEWTYTVYSSNPRDQYYFSKSGRSYDKTGTIGVQKHTFHPLIVDAKARNVNRSEQCGDEYSGYSNSFARYYGVVKKGHYRSTAFYNQALNEHVPLAYYLNRRSRSLSVKMLHIWDWLNELYLHKDLNPKEIDAIKNWLSIANENINASVEIRHLRGRVMRTQKLSEGTTNVSLHGLPKGLYVVRFTINNVVHHEVITL